MDARSDNFVEMVYQNPTRENSVVRPIKNSLTRENLQLAGSPENVD